MPDGSVQYSSAPRRVSPARPGVRGYCPPVVHCHIVPFRHSRFVVAQACLGAAWVSQTSLIGRGLFASDFLFQAAVRGCFRTGACGCRDGVRRMAGHLAHGEPENRDGLSRSMRCGCRSARWRWRWRWRWLWTARRLWGRGRSQDRARGAGARVAVFGRAAFVVVDLVRIAAVFAAAVFVAAVFVTYSRRKTKKAWRIRQA